MGAGSGWALEIGTWEFYTIGSMTSTVVPLSRSLSIEIVPPLNSTKIFSIVITRPEPEAFVEKYVSKARAKA